MLDALRNWIARMRGTDTEEESGEPFEAEEMLDMDE